MEPFSLEDLDEIDLLLSEIKISQGRGNLILCQVASPAYREKIIHTVQRRFSSKVHLVDNGDRLISDLRNMKQNKNNVLIWILPETLSNDIINALNNFRELFYEIGVPSLVFLTPASLDDAIRQAPDFWRYRGGFHVFKCTDEGPAFQAMEALSTPLDMSYQSKEELLRRKRINEYLLEKIKDKKGMSDIFLELGNIHLLLSEERKAINFYEQALTISREIGNRQSEGKDLGNLGLAYTHLGEDRKAIKYYDQALKISREIGDQLGEGNRLGNLGLACANLGETKKAIDFFEQALAISREIGDRRGEVTRLGNLGVAYDYLGETQKGIECLEQALAISREIKDMRREGAALGNLGVAYLHIGEMRIAIEYLEKALAISREIGDRRFEGYAHCNLGNAYDAMGELQKAIDYYEHGLIISREIGDRKGEGNNLFNLSIALNKIGKRTQAIDYAKSALVIFELIESPSTKAVRKKIAEWQAPDTPK